MKRAPFCLLLLAAFALSACRQPQKPHLVVGSKFFTEQVVLAELLAQHIEARTGISVVRETNLGGTLLIQKAMQAGGPGFYLEKTGKGLAAGLDGGAEGGLERGL